MGRNVLQLADRRIDARGMQHRAAEAVDRTGIDTAERRDPGGVVRVRLRNDVEQRRPTAAQPEDLVAVVIEQPSDERLDGGVEAGYITAAGEDGDSFGHGGW